MAGSRSNAYYEQLGRARLMWSRCVAAHEERARLRHVGNVTLPTPVFVAGGALALLAGYFVGANTGPDRPVQSTATVVSYQPKSGQLCLTGDEVTDHPGAQDGRLCGRWRRTDASAAPSKGDAFRFVSIVTTAEGRTQTMIYGDVVS